MDRNSTLGRFLATPWIAELLALLAGGLYLVQSWTYAHTRESILDEGAYLYKGYLFVTGQYAIYQDYGTWSNHMPLSFYIPGYAQLLFGPGLRTGRYLAIILGLLTLVGLWVLVRRVGGRWWAAAAVWVIAINPVMIKMYSVMVSQVLIACMLMWMLVLVLGERRSLWQIGLGSALAGMMVLTRINLAPVLPLLVLYVFWQHGRKAGILATIVGGLTLLIGHALFWPNILRMWAFWIPESISPFLDAWRPPSGATPSWDPNIDAAGRLLSFFLIFRVSFVAMVGAFITWLLWPRKDQWKNRGDFRSAVFLSSLILILLLAHMWATLSKNYCVFCLPGYTTFFSVAGIVLIVVTFAIWRKQMPVWYQLILAVFIVFLSAGIGYAAFETIGNPLQDIKISRALVGYDPPSASIRIGKWLHNNYEMEYAYIRRMLPTVAGFGVGLLILLIALIVSAIYDHQRKVQRSTFGYWALVIFLIAGTLFAPTQPFGGGYDFYECEGDVTQSYQQAGEHLAQVIPAGSKIYWKGGLSVAPLLYVPDIQIYPSQINSDYTYYIGGDPDELAQYGFWNEALAQQWVQEADYILVQERYYTGWLADVTSTDLFEELAPTPPTVYCREDTQIHIFKKIK